MEFDITFSAGFGDGRMVSEVSSVFIFQEVGVHATSFSFC